MLTSPKLLCSRLSHFCFCCCCFHLKGNAVFIRPFMHFIKTSRSSHNIEVMKPDLCHFVRDIDESEACRKFEQNLLGN